MPQVVPPESLPSANALTGLSYQITGVVGPAIGAAMVAVGGTPSAFGLDSLSFFVSAAFLAPLLRIALPRTAEMSSRSAVRDLRDGLAEVAGRAWLWLSIAFFGLVNVVDAGPRNVALPFLIHDHLGLEVGGLGAVTSSIAIGSVSGGRLPRPLPPAASSRPPALRLRDRHGPDADPDRPPSSLPGLMAAAFVYGICISIGSLAWTNSLQEMVPHERLGACRSIDVLGSFIFLPLGFAFAGILTERIGPANVFVLGGSLVVLLAAGMLLVPSIRRLD